MEVVTHKKRQLGNLAWEEVGLKTRNKVLKSSFIFKFLNMCSWFSTAVSAKNLSNFKTSLACSSEIIVLFF
jgi:hypothetical protein